MTVYVESNFALELALEQEEHRSAEEILSLATRREIDVAFPAFCVCEPFTTLSRRGIQRDQLSQQIGREVTQLARSDQHHAFASTFKSLGEQLREIKKAEMDGLEKALDALLNSSTIIPITAQVFAKAVAYEKRHSLAPPDAMVYASVISDLESRKAPDAKCFISRNPTDFGTRSIRTELQSLNCIYIPRLSDGLTFIKNNLP